MEKIKNFFQAIRFIVRIKIAFLKYRIKNKDFTQYRLTDKYLEITDYIAKCLDDETYTYSDYKELLYYNQIKDSAEKRGVSKEIILYEILTAIVLFS